MGAEVWAEGAAAWIATFAIHGTVVFVAVWALARTARLSEPLEEVLWRFGLLVGLVTATVQIVAGGGLVSIPLGMADTPPPAGPIAALVADPGAALASGAGTSTLESTAGRALAADSGVGLAAFVVVLAVAAGVFGLARLGLRRVALRGLLAERRPLLPGSPLSDALECLRIRAGHRRGVRLSVSGELDAPVAFGVLRPEICVPRRALHELSRATQDAMLAHELAHLVRRDPLWLELAHTLQAVFPWQPFFPVAARRLRAIAEFRCDALGARWVDPLDVADCLVEVAAWLADRRGVVALEGLVGMTVRREGLEARVDRLLDQRARGGERDLSASALASGLVGATLLLATALPGVGTSVAREAATSIPSPPVEVPASDPAVALSDPEVAPEADPWGALLGLVDAERAALAREIELLAEDVGRRAPDPELQRLCEALDARVVSLDARRTALAVAIRDYLDAIASSEPTLSETR